MDPPGHTVFLYLRELNRSELQKQAKLYGIKANQKSEVLRQQLQEILTTRNSMNNSPQSVAVVKKEQQQVDTPVSIDTNVMALGGEEVEVEQPTNNVDHGTISVAAKKKPEEKGTQPSGAAKRKDLTTVNRLEPDTESVWIEVDEEEENEAVEKEEEEASEPSNTKRDEAENEEMKNAPPQVVFVDLDSDEMVELADESIESPTTAAKETRMFRSKIPTSSSGGPSVARKVLGERTLNSVPNCKSNKLAKSSKRQFQPSKIGSVTEVIRNKNSPLRRPPSHVTRKPVLITKTSPRPKRMPLSQRNELQYQKFLERQIRGRKNRQEQLDRAQFATFVRSP